MENRAPTNDQCHKGVYYWVGTPFERTCSIPEAVSVCLVCVGTMLYCMYAWQCNDSKERAFLGHELPNLEKKEDFLVAKMRDESHSLFRASQPSPDAGTY